MENYIQPIREFTYQVTAKDIMRFSQATGDVEVKHQSANKNTEDPGLMIAPTLFCQSLAYESVPVAQLPSDLSPIELFADTPTTKTVGGSSDYEFSQYVLEGDTITVTSGVRSIEKKEGRSGTLYLVKVETYFRNQFGEKVAKEIATYVKR
ncbi:MaoC family dehydratase N-terminal domain-containing protein [Reinekea sp.]|jgi:acyl dehydratase|uniref:FAS1-like dehydratase domain-containing protein n=1 Tax=Reinekea sp. TaxID=1970455 RepID=UPI00398963B5